MATKKVGPAGRFGPRYGTRVKKKIVKIEIKQRKKQKCPFCGKLGVKRIAKGLWECPKCKKRFASDAYYLN